MSQNRLSRALLNATLTILVATQVFASARVATAQAVPSQTELPHTTAVAAVTTSITLDGTEGGPVFGGVGAISGGGGNSRLLIDYPAKQRDEILDYLFKPGYGAALQILKLEIGGDANSTDGSEPSVEHTAGTINCNAGYEFWLAEQAKRRNPEIKLYGLAWAAPGWIDHGSFWSQDTIDYLMTWMDCARSHGLKVDYLGGWNERGFDRSWYENLHATLHKKHYTTQVVGDDSGWDVADDMVKDADFAKSIDIIGVHYSCEGGDGGIATRCRSTQNALSTHKQLWDSESGSQDDNTGTASLIRAITRGYVDSQMTGFLNWPLLAAVTSNLPYPTVGLMVAGQPWSGNYSLGKSLWATAQVTQFSQPGWLFSNGASGYLGNDRANGSYITLRSPEGTDWSTVVETTTATLPSTLTFDLHGKASDKPIHIWSTNLAATADEALFVPLADLSRNNAGHAQFTLRPGFIYTLSTIATAGKGKTTPPPADPLVLPYRENFDQYKNGQEARLVSDMQGSFEVQPCAAGRSGRCLQQMATIKPIEWQDDSDAFTLLGDPSWTNYTAGVDVELSTPGVIELIGRAGTQKRPQSHQEGYYFRISDLGIWTLLKCNSRGEHKELSQGTVTPLGTGSWHRLDLSFRDDHIVAYVDKQAVTTVTDNSYNAGQVGVGLVGYEPDQFDNLSITEYLDSKDQSH